MRKWWWLIVVGVAMLIGIGYAIFGTLPESKPINTTTALIEAKDIDLKEEKDGQLLWRVKAERIMTDPIKQVFYLERARLWLYSDGSEVQIVADKGEIDYPNKMVRITGGVRAVRTDGLLVEAQRLTYDGKSEVLTADEQIKIVQDDQVITGDRLVTDRGLAKIRVLGNAKLVKGAKQ